MNPPQADGYRTPRGARQIRHDRLALLVVIGLGGAIGTGIRHGMTLAVPPDSGEYPVATFLVNVVGAVLLGVIAELPTGSLPAHELTRPALGTGFCGGLTTFSTMSLQIYQLWPGHPEVAAGYAAASVSAAPACAWAGAALVQTVRAGRGPRRPSRVPPEQEKR
jgi:fluoride exporter